MSIHLRGKNKNVSRFIYLFLHTTFKIIVFKCFQMFYPSISFYQRKNYLNFNSTNKVMPSFKNSQDNKKLKVDPFLKRMINYHELTV